MTAGAKTLVKPFEEDQIITLNNYCYWNLLVIKTVFDFDYDFKFRDWVVCEVQEDGPNKTNKK